MKWINKKLTKYRNKVIVFGSSFSMSLFEHRKRRIWIFNPIKLKIEPNKTEFQKADNNVVLI